MHSVDVTNTTRPSGPNGLGRYQTRATPKAELLSALSTRRAKAARLMLRQKGEGQRLRYDDSSHVLGYGLITRGHIEAAAPAVAEEIKGKRGTLLLP
jgi:hypothetical protein